MDALHHSNDARAWIREAIRALGLNQQELAQTIGISNSHLSNFLGGKRELDGAKVDLLAAALGLDPPDRALLHQLLALKGATGLHRDTLERQIGARRNMEQARQLPPHEVEALNGPLTLVLRELAACQGASADPVALSQRLIPPMEADEVLAALDRLEQHGLITRGPGDALGLGSGASLSLRATPEAQARWCATAAGWCLEALEDMEVSARKVELLVQAVPARLMAEVATELNGLTYRVQHRCDQSLEQGQPGDRVQVLLVRLWPLTGPLLGDLAVTHQPPTPALGVPADVPLLLEVRHASSGRRVHQEAGCNV